MWQLLGSTLEGPLPVAARCSTASRGRLQPPLLSARQRALPCLQPAAPFIDRVLEPLARLGFYASSTNAGENPSDAD